jgi:hypothetical protein
MGKIPALIHGTKHLFLSAGNAPDFSIYGARISPHPNTSAPKIRVFSRPPHGPGIRKNRDHGNSPKLLCPNGLAKSARAGGRTTKALTRGFWLPILTVPLWELDEGSADAVAGG